MAIDMGGPFNKAAYVFRCCIRLHAGNYDIMATVMIGGMVPPIAQSHLQPYYLKINLQKKKEKQDQQTLLWDYAFITEGAIPFAASDPLHVITCMYYRFRQLAGALSMVFNCTLMAPHGGIFVFPVVGNGLMYFVALVAGTIVSAVLLGALKKKVA